MISIPPQNCLYTNKDIIKLNTIIKDYCHEHNIEIINTHKFIKTEHLAQDGIHLSRRAKNWLSTKITGTILKEDMENCWETVEYSENEPNYRNTDSHESKMARANI